MKAPWIGGAALDQHRLDVPRGQRRAAPADSRPPRAAARPRHRALERARAPSTRAAPRADGAARPPAPTRSVRSRPSSTTRTARAPAGARQAHRQPRIVGPHRARADQHGVVRGAQLVRRAARRGPGDPDRPRRAARRAPSAMKPSSVAAAFSVTSGRRSRDPDREGADGRAALGLQAADVDAHAGAAQARDAAARRRAGSDRGSRRRRAPGRAARIASRARARCGRCGSRARGSRRASRRARAAARSARERVHLGVRLARAPVEALGEHAPAAHDHRAHDRVRPRRAPPALRERERAAHEALVRRRELAGAARASLTCAPAPRPGS